MRGTINKDSESECPREKWPKGEDSRDGLEDLPVQGSLNRVLKEDT